MPPNKELCRNFKSGSCRYGDRCKFSHATQQHQKTNAFGFGSQTGTSFQPQNSNPFGFGVQNSGPANGSGGFKPFENKWVRPGQPANQSQAAQSQGTNHECTDPAVCKRLIADDFQNERPIWKLTCYGHYKHLPCDISGDVSYEELRAEAYNDAKRGLSIQAIVEREKNLEKSKLIECENLLHNPYNTKQTQSAMLNQSPFSKVATTFPTLIPQSTVPSPFSSFGPQQGPSSKGPSSNVVFGAPQQGPSPNTTFPSPAPQNSGPSAFPGFGPQQGSSPNMSFGMRPSTPSNNGFPAFQGSGLFGSNSGPSGLASTQVPSQASGNRFASNTTIFGSGGLNGQSSLNPAEIGGNASVSSMSPFTNSGVASQGSNLPSSVPVSHTPAINPPLILSNGLTDAISAEQRHIAQKEVVPADASIWLKAEWKLEEIPEQPPPAEYVR